MRKEFYVTVFIMALSGWAFAFQPVSDSATIVTPSKKYTPTLVMRVHSSGMFLYMGKVVNHNPAADIFFTYTSASGWGVSAFKVVDLTDIHSHNNFSFALLNKVFRVGSRLTVTPNLGIALEQQHKFVDHGSDVLGMLNSAFRINKSLVVDHTAMLNNLIFNTSSSDWTNRFRLLYSNGHFDITGLYWHNNGLIDGDHYSSAGASIFYNRLKLSKKAFLGAGVTVLWTTNYSNPEQIHYERGIQFSTSLTFK